MPYSLGQAHGEPFTYRGVQCQMQEDVVCDKLSPLAHGICADRALPTPGAKRNFSISDSILIA